MVLQQTKDTKEKDLTVWYDGQCPLCLREIGLMQRLDRRGAIRFIDVHKGRDCPLDPETLLARFHAQERGEPVVSGAAAFAAMWRAVPLLRPLGLAARWRPLLWVLEWLYLRFLRIRPALQRWAGDVRGASSQAGTGSG